MIPAAVKRATKKIVDYPENEIHVISTKDWVSRSWTNPLFHIKTYLLSLFPILTWIRSYHLSWLSEDFIAGITVGIVVVPQGMSYAQVATLPPQYGLYSSIVGALIYGIFATSKDVSIGTTAVLSLTIANVIESVQGRHPDVWDRPTIASTAGLVSGFIVLGIGLLRIGWIVDFIPMPVISGFTTGAAITIMTGQLPGLLGISGFDTRAAPFKVIISSLKGLPRTQLDAAWGLPPLLVLYAIKRFSLWAPTRWPRRARWFFFLNVMRNSIVILIMTIAAFLYCRNRRDGQGRYPIKMLEDVPAGLKRVAPHRIDSALVSAMAGDLPMVTIISFIEHIAIAKSFGRLNGYKINPNQELIAIGVTNTVGTCFGAYPATGSFSLTALQSKSGVRTPLSGVVTSTVVIAALYGLTKAFFWIPDATLSAVIIHSVADLIATPDQVFRYWRISPLEFFIWLATVLIAVFVAIEDAIYISTGISLLILLVRLAHPRGSFLGKVFVESESETSRETREVFIPTKKDNIHNPRVKIVPPAPGVLVYRLEDSCVYPNCAMVNSVLVEYVKENMRRGKNMGKARDRLWNDTGSGHSSDFDQMMNEKKPWLHAVVFDFSAISHLDTTATQAFVDTRVEIERWTNYPVEFHFATILSPWIRRALVTGGFGYGTSHSQVSPEVVAVLPRDDDSQTRETSMQSQDDIEKGEIKTEVRHQEEAVQYQAREPLLPSETPFFHPDLASAVRAAESGLGRVANVHHKKFTQGEDLE